MAFGSYSNPNEPVLIEQVIQVVGFLAALGLLVVIGRALLQAIFPSAFPGEVVAAHLATYWVNPGQTPTAKDLDRTTCKQYDYIIIGTGTAGCVIASRLSEDPSVSVLAIEAGHSDLKQLYSRIPAAFPNLFRTAADHDIKTKPEKHMNDRVFDWPRGKMLGGCSAINAMIYNRGAPDDYNEWERLGNPGWSYADVRPFFDKAEGFKSGKYNKLNDQEMAQHGTFGPWQTGYTSTLPVNTAFIDACAAVGIESIPDFNTHHGTNGAGRFQTFIDEKGQRSSTAVSYLTADVVKRPNLSISVGQTVTRILFDTSGPKPRAAGVELGSSSASPVRYIAAARKEVILCAGAIHTPQVLNLSGIGAAADLAKHDIPLVKDLPAVGANLADHLMTVLVAKTAPNTSLHWLTTPSNTYPSLARWLWNGSGPLTTNIAETACFIRLSDYEDAPAELKKSDETSGSTASDLEILSAAAAHVNHGHTKFPNGDYHSLGSILLRPLSRGSITLASASPFTPPDVTPNYLSHPKDAAVLLYGLKLSRRILTAKPFSQYFRGWALPGNTKLAPLSTADDVAANRASIYTGTQARVNADTMDDEEWLKFIRDTSETVYHPMCTAKMGPDEKDSVVDARLKVHGVLGLRVADASIFPTPLACHPCAGVVMVGEKASALIKEDARSGRKMKA